MKCFYSLLSNEYTQSAFSISLDMSIFDSAIVEELNTNHTLPCSHPYQESNQLVFHLRIILNLRIHHIWRTSLVLLLISNTPGFNEVADMSTIIDNLRVVTHVTATVSGTPKNQ